MLGWWIIGGMHVAHSAFHPMHLSTIPSHLPIPPISSPFPPASSPYSHSIPPLYHSLPTPSHLLPIPPIHTVVEKVELLTDRLNTLLAERVLERIPEVPTTCTDHAHGPASHPVADPFPHTVIQSSLQSRVCA